LDSIINYSRNNSEPDFENEDLPVSNPYFIGVGSANLNYFRQHRDII